MRDNHEFEPGAIILPRQPVRAQLARKSEPWHDRQLVSQICRPNWAWVHSSPPPAP